MKHVVIVDDSNPQLMVLKLLLNQMGIDPISFLDPLQALEYLKNNKTDLLITDYKMPRMDGLELITEARYGSSQLHTAMVSGMRDIDGTLQKECDSLNIPLLLKPFDALDFQNFMNALIKRDALSITCIKNKKSRCILRDKVATGSCMHCCLDEMEDEKEIFQSVIDVIEDFYPHKNMLDNLSNRLSFMADAVCVGQNYELQELFMIMKQLSIVLHEYQERLLEDEGILALVVSYFHVISDWLKNTFFLQTVDVVENYYDSLKADFQSIEMALGFCVIDEDYEEALDDLFF